MSILIGTSKTRYPDFGDPSGGVSGLEDRAKNVLSNIFDTLGARIFTNSFVEDGVQNVPGSSFIDSQFANLQGPSKRQVKTQHTEATILLKKRMFSTLKENYDVRFMDDDERIFLRAVKNLFRRKCEQIAFFENLTQLEEIIEDPSFLTIDKFLDNIVGALEGFLTLGFGVGTAFELGGLAAGAGSGVGDVFNSDLLGLFDNPVARTILDIVFKLRNTNQRAKQNKFTTWIVDSEATDVSSVGTGTGVIEFTLATKIDTSVTLESGGGGCTLSLEDPYKLTRITESDIEFALSSAHATESGFPGFFDLRGVQLMEEAQELDMELNELRRSRGKSEINFEFPFGTEDAVIGIVVNINFPFETTTIRNIPPEETLSSPEGIRVTQIFGKLREYKTIQDRAMHDVLIDINPVIRDKMRREFVGHHIFQQMDALHIFLNSFTRDATPVYANRGDLVLGDLALQTITFEEQTGKISDEILEQERKVLVPDLPLSVYKLLRNPVEFRGTGPQIFSGLITEIIGSYEASAGTFTLNVQAKDNMHFLELSRINVQPGLTQPQGELEDPLTPFDIKTDEATGLVDDRELSGTNRKRLQYMFIQDPPFLGERIGNEERLLMDTSSGGNNALRTYRHVPGLTYKWKDGIIAATQTVNLVEPLSGRHSLASNINDDFGLTITQSPFSNLDAADILSILITGRPHNYNTFIQHATDSGNFTIDSSLNKKQYFNYLFDFLERQNSVNGNFVPAMQSTIDPGKTAQTIAYQRSLNTNISTINKLQKERALLEDRMRNLPAIEDSQIIIEARKQLQQQISIFDEKISTFNAAINQSQEEQGENAQFKVFGNSVQVHYSETDLRELGKRIKYILRNKPEEVKYNQDKNYFVVSERYSSDTDIQAFVLNLKNGGFDLFNSEFQSPIETCKEVAAILNFELFADSQGNIIFRPPEYNKTPLSLLFKMLELGRNDGIQLAPPFLMKLIGGRVGLVQNKALLLDLQIFEQTLLLGNQELSGIFEVGAEAPVAARRGLNLALKVDAMGNYAFDLDKAMEELGRSIVFSEGAQTEAAFNRPDDLVPGSPALPPTSAQAIATKIITVRNQIKNLQGSTTAPQNPKDSQIINSILDEISEYDVGLNTNAASNRLRVTNRIASLTTERQTNLQLWNKLSLQQRDLTDANNALGLGQFGHLFNSALANTPFERDEPFLPTFLEDLVEDDFQNNTGFNSGKRFIIKDDVILSMQFAIQTPEFNRIDVQGDEDLVGPGLRDANPLQFWAGATDFDSWRQFGYRAGRPKIAPFLQNPETQCAPYATFMLNQQRRKIHSGSLTLIGNEHYEVGDVVYVNNRQMLYYVERVDHSFAFGENDFQTTLKLSYGHALGDYIPTPLDIIGKSILSNNRKGFGGLKANRSLVPADTMVHLETLYLPWDARVDSQDSNDLSKMFASFARDNMPKIRNAIIKGANKINSTNQDIARIEFRGFGISTDSSLRTRVDLYLQFAQVLMAEGIMPDSTINLTDTFSINYTTDIAALAGEFTPSQLQFKNIVQERFIINIDQELSEKNSKFRRMPSTEAWAYGSDVTYNQVTGLPVNAIDIAFVVDKSLRGDQPAFSAPAAPSLPSFDCTSPEMSSTNSGVQNENQ